METLRPYITAALLCEKVLIEKDESLTLVRIADRIQYRLEGRGLPEGVKPVIAVQGLISLKSGPVTGGHAIRIVGEKPNGDRKDVFSAPVTFLGKDQGQNVIMSIALGIDQDGLYWFDVLFDGELLTRIPLMVTPLGEQTPKDPKT
jgi:hypothetical protein